MSTDEEFCAFTDLRKGTCAHCSGKHEFHYGDRALEALAIHKDRGGFKVLRELESGPLFNPRPVTKPTCGDPCTLCGRLAGDHYLCPTCIEQFEVDCANVPTLLAELDITITRLDNVYAPAAPPTAEQDEPMMYSVAASQAKDALRTAHITAASAILGGANWEGGTTTQDVAAYNALHGEDVALYTDADTLAGNIRDATTRALRAIDTMPERILAGTCPTCGNRLMAFKDATKVWCDTCKERRVVADLRQAMLDRLADQQGSVNALHEMLRAAGEHIPLGTIKRWSSQGELPCVGITDAGSRAHRFGDLMVMVEKRKARVA